MGTRCVRVASYFIDHGSHFPYILYGEGERADPQRGVAVITWSYSANQPLVPSHFNFLVYDPADTLWALSKSRSKAKYFMGCPAQSTKNLVWEWVGNIRVNVYSLYDLSLLHLGLIAVMWQLLTFYPPSSLLHVSRCTSVCLLYQSSSSRMHFAVCTPFS